MAYRDKKILLCSFSLFPPPLLLPHSIYSSLMLCRSDEYHPSKSEMQRNLSLSFLTLFSLPFLVLLSSPPSLLLWVSLLSPSFDLISLTTLLSFLAYVDLILPHYDDLRFSFSGWPIKKQTAAAAASPAFPYIAVSFIRWPLLCILHYKLEYKNCPSVLFLCSDVICLNSVLQPR